jgi:hypothetical protein
MTPQEVDALFHDWKKAPAAEPEEALEEKLSKIPSRNRIELFPGVTRRKAGTLQKGSTHVGGTRWTYDKQPLVLAVACLRKWAPAEVISQRYALIVSLRHTAESVRLWDRLRQSVRVAQRVRVRVSSAGR